MKNQALFSSKYKSKKLKCCLLQFLFGALRVKRVVKVSKSDRNLQMLSLLEMTEKHEGTDTHYDFHNSSVHCLRP